MALAPTPSRKQVAHKLRGLRASAGIGSVEAARRAGMSQSKVSKLENGRLRASVDDVRALCAAYGADSRDRDELVELATGLREESQRSRVTLSRGAGRLQQRIGRLEVRSTLLRSFQPAMVIGLLQTEDYAQAVAAEVLDGEDLVYQVAAKTARKSVLDDPQKRFVLIMSEGALRWQVGGPQLMAAQVDFLVEVTRRTNVRLGIVPWTTSAAVTCTHGFHLYDSAAVTFGTEVASGVLDDAEDIAVYEQLFGRIEALASFGDDARRELARIGNDYRLLA